MLLFEPKQHLQSYKVKSKGRYLLLKNSFFKDYNKRLVGTTRASPWISDITNPAPANTQSMLRRVVVKHICE